MTNNKFKRHNRNAPHKPAISREQFVKEIVSQCEYERFMAFVHALDPLVNACKSVESQIMHPAFN